MLGSGRVGRRGITVGWRSCEDASGEDGDEGEREHVDVFDVVVVVVV